MKAVICPSISTLYSVEVENNYGETEQFQHDEDGSWKFWEILLLNPKKDGYKHPKISKLLGTIFRNKSIGY